MRISGPLIETPLSQKVLGVTVGVGVSVRVKVGDGVAVIVGDRVEVRVWVIVAVCVLK